MVECAITLIPKKLVLIIHNCKSVVKFGFNRGNLIGKNSGFNKVLIKE
jgi:hypothetical protein